MAFPWLYVTVGLSWLVFGLAVLTGWLDGPWTTIRVGDSRFSAGWLAVALGLYNLVRWYNRKGLRNVRAWEQAQNNQRQNMLKQARASEEANPSGPA